MPRRFARSLLAAGIAAPLLLMASGQAEAAVPTDKAAVLSSWTQTSVSSYDAWNAARQNQAAWSAYQFDWSTDYCTTSPDNPFGFPFKNACARHDFGYRNYKAAGTFSANKDRLDSAFYADLKRVCAGYSGATATSCNATAWTYYQAVSIFGLSPAVDGTADAR
ncbi:phospholipase [Streptomyces sp. NRRL B-24572]|uniref:phospholipase n=1 Tax=Streptomyces sp. NRRL B-24572 TaxID=1962156 RepID=UPI000A3CA04D|nr:phospholipase [Streptomyces sp. NRRL B-24572]